MRYVDRLMCQINGRRDGNKKISLLSIQRDKSFLKMEPIQHLSLPSDKWLQKFEIDKRKEKQQQKKKKNQKNDFLPYLSGGFSEEITST